jgi:chromosome condensin MukBEF ATPase and DNA-binding subunit MukB
MGNCKSCDEINNKYTNCHFNYKDCLNTLNDTKTNNNNIKKINEQLNKNIKSLNEQIINKDNIISNNNSEINKLNKIINNKNSEYNKCILDLNNNKLKNDENNQQQLQTSLKQCKT